MGWRWRVTPNGGDGEREREKEREGGNGWWRRDEPVRLEDGDIAPMLPVVQVSLESLTSSWRLPLIVCHWLSLGVCGGQVPISQPYLEDHGLQCVISALFIYPPIVLLSSVRHQI